ncbi:hypothetical protein QR680_011504 [Steinernema hermaphroditum]|uniref:Peptidase S1 domain-containing protein n=1 Tax=Steinernema hermaphroditum TaxID=289476 RepID=A0AA39LY70_9BILA|nr:hypothetical protein QR680_011504 [Steinernema hermaphroditum]
MRFVLSCLALIGLSLAAPAVLPPEEAVRSELVIGGERAYQGHFPFYAKIPGCGGSLITPKHILTAAHCVDQSSVGDDVVMGLDDREEYEKEHGVQIRKIISVTNHRDYNYNNLSRDDISILEIDQPFEISNYVQLMNIKRDDTELQKKYWSLAIGFGLSNITKNDDGTYSGVWPRYLQYAYIPLIPYEQCKKVWFYLLWEKQVCIGGDRLGVGNGDSGGPLSILDDGKFYQIGVASYIATGQYFNQNKYPAVFTRTASYCDWMTENTNGAFHCL